MLWNYFAVASAVAAMPFLVVSSCDFSPSQTGPLHDEPVSINLDNARTARVRLNLGAGELMIRGGADHLLRGHFEYNVVSWKPIVTYDVTGPDANVTIKQPENSGHFGNSRNTWDLTLNNKVLLDFELNCGAGKAQLEMGEMNLQKVAIHMGAGEVNLDLRGNPTRDYDVSVQGGVGHATVYVPENVGVRAEAHGGIGHIDVSGLDKNGGYYQNKLYGNSKVNVNLTVEGGIGEIQIIG